MSLAYLDTVLDRHLEHARKYLNAHPEAPGIQDTFGYFTRHPVAPLNRKRLRLILAELERQKSDKGRPLRILDLACGGGIISTAAAALGHRVLGMDLNPSETRLAEGFTCAIQETRAQFLTVDLMKNPDWERTATERLGGKPDVILLAYALHHLPDVPALLKRFASWLDAGSVLLVNEENPHSPTFRLKHLVRTVIQRDTEVEHHRSLGGWRRLLEAQGFRISSLAGADILPATGRWAPRMCWSLVFTAKYLPG